MSLDAFLASTDVIDWKSSDIVALANDLRGSWSDNSEIARAAFEWVRDEIKHTVDYDLEPVTCKASDVLRRGTGFCYAKSHLLAALLRANGIPAGFCYQRLSIDGQGPPFCLHGLNAVLLPDHGWYRIDARGNKPGVNALFDPPHERLAFETALPGEQTIPGIRPEPLEIVVEALRSHKTSDELCKNLPDVEP
jgi:transglutaminase-like putative cysteine protease